MGLFDGIVRIATGNVAHDAADSGNPLKIGGKARTTTPTAVAANDRVDAFFDEYGRLWTNENLRSTYGFAYGGGSGSITGTSDWLIARGASPDSFSWPMSTVAAAGNVLEFFDSDHANFNGDPIWILIPMAVSNYARANVTIFNTLGVSMDVTAYLLPANAAFATVSPVAAQFFSIVGDSADPYTVTDGTRLHIGLGCTADDAPAHYLATDWPVGALLLKCDPASDPSGGEHWSIGVMRSR